MALLDDRHAPSLPPLERALAGFANVLSDAPWTLTADDIEKLRGVGLSEASILHAVVLSSYFNYLNRVADAVDIDFDYQSPLPKMHKSVEREPWPRPEPAAWPRGATPLSMKLSDRPNTHQPFVRWRQYVLEREAPLSRRDRQVLARAAAHALADARGFEQFPSAGPRDRREETLAAFAVTLTSAPWRLDDASIGALRALGLDDLAVLDVISVASFQNTASRLNLVLAEV